MRQIFFIASFYFCISLLIAQPGDSIITRLKFINKQITIKPCNSVNAAAISNRAMNVFLADKTGYVSESGDLSFYTNYVTLNTSEGKFTINHNFQKVKGIDEPIQKLLSIGISVNIANSFTATFLDKQFENELGLTINYKWIGKVKTHFAPCVQSQNGGNQKQAMDALRAAILHSLEMEIHKKEVDFKVALNRIDTTDVPAQNIDKAREVIQQNFYEDLQETYEEKSATQQAEVLTKTQNFKLINTYWTSFTAYIPLAFPKYTVAQSLTSALQEKHSYPLQLILSHTRFWESSKAGRIFFTLNGNMLFNNSKLGSALNKVTLAAYKNLGGTDTIHLANFKNDRAYIGSYETFVTPSLKARIVYYPTGSHVGISFLAEQNFGRYNVLNGRLGMPIVLINSKKTPAVNFEIYVLFFDMNNKIKQAEKFGNKTSIGLEVGIPFSRLMY